jgi:glycine cleavage system H protein
MNVPNNLKYSKTHEWVRVEGNVAVVGVTDHAQEELTDIVYVENPSVGAHVEATKGCAVVESVKAASDIYSPVSGEIVEANEELSNTPESVNDDPYGKGWLFKIKMSDPAELNDLLSPDDYSHHIGG